MISIPRLVKRMVPAPCWQLIVRVWETPLVRRIRYFGLSHFCPICRAHLSQFEDYGWIHILKEEECPVCGLHRRHRLMWRYFPEKMRIFERPKFKLLHVAPEPSFLKLFKRSPNIDYVSADLTSPLAMVKMDLTNIQYPDNSFDAIYCSHVLEHIPEDRKAMDELYRVLKPGGWAILQVPLDITRERTFEDPSITAPEDRERAFGQGDHVRLYGRDYKDRLEAAGFTVDIDWFVRSFSDREIRRLQLNKDEGIYLCTKPAAREVPHATGCNAGSAVLKEVRSVR